MELGCMELHKTEIISLEIQFIPKLQGNYWGLGQEMCE